MRVLICGAGIAGVALAWWLERDGHEVLLVERSHGRRASGYMVDLRDAGFDAAERMGLLPALRRRAVALSELVYHADDGRVIERFVDDGPGAERTLSLMRGELELAMHRTLAPSVPIRAGLTVESIEEREDHLEVTLGDGESESVDLLIGADGLHSRIRALHFGPEERFLRDLGYQTAAFLVEDAALADELAGGLHMLEAPGRQVSAYPVGQQVAATFTHRTPPGEPLPGDVPASLHQRYGQLGGMVPRLLAGAPDPAHLYSDRVAQVEMPTWSRGRIALVGDACHAMSLLTGQGTARALSSAESLAGRLRGTTDVPRALSEYDLACRPEVTGAQREGREFAEDFIPR